MVKEKEGCHSRDIIERGHGFNPFGKIVNCDDNIPVIATLSLPNITLGIPV